jgi:opacity protein-like surface antigen
MSHLMRPLLFLALLTAIPAAPASAQATARVFIGVNGGYQASTTEFDDRFTFTRDQETGTTQTGYPIEAGATIDVGGGVRLWRGLGVGLAVTSFTRDGLARTTALVPHPLYLDRHREAAGEPGGIRREESAIHVQAQLSLPLTRRLHLTLMGGPSVLRVNQAMVIDVNYTEEYPYDTVTFTGVDTARQKGTKTGFNVGADVRWMFTSRIGAGALVRLARATIDLEAAADRTVSIDAGGVQAGAGLRIVF